MALWVAISVSLGCLLLGFVAGQIACGTANAELADHNWSLIQENSQLARKTARLESIVNVVTEEAI